MAGLDVHPVSVTAKVAAALAGRPIVACDALLGGRNSRVFRVECEDGQVFALKSYPPRDADARDRLGAEMRALRFMTAHHIRCVPNPIATHRDGFALLSWVQGRPVTAVTKPDIDVAVEFLAVLHSLRHESDASSIDLAAEACLSGDEVVRQVRRRFFRLQEIAADAPHLADTLRRKFFPAIEWAEDHARHGYAKENLDFAAPLAAKFRTLSPSDFGFHNALRCEDEKLAFVDFEYFGWDDPAKLICDTMIHPGMTLEPSLAQYFLSKAVATYRDEIALAARVSMLLPLYRMRWCAILLNEFLPERWTVRAHAGGNDRPTAQRRQLDKALRYLESEPLFAEVHP